MPLSNLEWILVELFTKHSDYMRILEHYKTDESEVCDPLIKAKKEYLNTLAIARETGYSILRKYGMEK